MAKPVRCAIAERVRVAAVAMLAERGIAISRAGDAGTERLSRACVAAGIDRAAVWLAAGVCPWVGGYVWLRPGVWRAGLVVGIVRGGRMFRLVICCGLGPTRGSGRLLWLDLE